MTVYMPYEYTEPDGTKRIYEYRINPDVQKLLDKFTEARIVNVLPEEGGEVIIFSVKTESGKKEELRVFQEYIEEEDTRVEDFILDASKYITQGIFIFAIGMMVCFILALT